MRLGIRTKVLRTARALVGSDARAAAALTLPIGQISLDEARFLMSLVRDIDTDGPIVEIGTLFGFSTRMMTLAKSPERELITVDNYAWNPLSLPPALHRRCTAEALDDAVRHHNVRIVNQDKDDFFDAYAGPSPALVFLDAVHSYEETRKDIAWARHAGARVICAHDYSPHHPGVVRAVDEAGGPARIAGTLAVLCS